MDYSYDGLGWLNGVAADSPAWSVSWQYDEYGNRLHQTATDLAAGRVATGTNRSFDENNRFDETGYTYDAAGNVTHAPVGSGFTVTYDAESRMTAVNTNQVQYVYDYAGRRVKRITASETTYYLYGLTGLMSEFSTTNTGITAAAATDRLTFIVPEHNGTGVLLVNESGAAIENNRVFPFGDPWQSDAISTSDEKYTRYHRDETTGFDYAMARWYASREGRFLSPDPGHAGADPAIPQSWNAYAYGMNDPVNSVDPDGLCSQGAESWMDDDGNFHLCIDVTGNAPSWWESLF